MKQLTKEILDKMEPETIIGYGVSTTLNLISDDRPLKWVAVRGYAPDWAIYAHEAHQTTEFVMQSGDKIHNRETIKRLIPCDEEALKSYRS